MKNEDVNAKFTIFAANFKAFFHNYFHGVSSG